MNEDRAAQVFADLEGTGEELGIEIIAAYGQEQFRAGAEALRDSVPRFTDDYGDTYIKLEDLAETANKLLAEQEKK